MSDETAKALIEAIDRLVAAFNRNHYQSTAYQQPTFVPYTPPYTIVPYTPPYTIVPYTPPYTTTDGTT